MFQIKRRFILVKHDIHTYWSVSIRVDLCNTSGWFFTWNVGGNTNLLFRNNFVEHIPHLYCDCWPVYHLLSSFSIVYVFFPYSLVKSIKTSRMEIVDHMRFVVHLLIGRPVMINPNQKMKKKSQLLMAPYANGLWEAVRIRNPWLAEITHIHEPECGWEWHDFWK